MTPVLSAPAPALRRILVADDDPVSRMLLVATLCQLGYEVTACEDGDAALAALGQHGGPQLAILDWEMPGMSGPDVCRGARARRPDCPMYLVLLTSRGGTSNVVTGLRSGANDYLTKPFDREELAARLAVAGSFLALQVTLAERVRELEFALAQIKTLRGLLPICAWCKKIRDDGNYWRQVEDYVCHHTDARFTHGICPDCEHRLDDEVARFTAASPSATPP